MAEMKALNTLDVLSQDRIISRLLSSEVFLVDSGEPRSTLKSRSLIGWSIIYLLSPVACLSQFGEHLYPQDIDCDDDSEIFP